MIPAGPGNEIAMAVHRPRVGPRRLALRLVVAVSYIVGVVLALQLAGLGLRGVTDEPAQAELVEPTPAVAAPPRPGSAPAQIPAWAWGMYRWHDDRHGNVRPLAAPRTMPRWYWEWREWRTTLADRP